MKIKLASTAAEVDKCFEVMVQLRPDLSRQQFAEQVKRQQKTGYKLAFVEVEGQVVCVAGFRFSENLSWGKFMYIDDLVTDAGQRSKGYGDALLDWLINFAETENCRELHLDSGVQRHDAHRFYLRKRLDIIAHHFAIKLKSR